MDTPSINNNTNMTSINNISQNSTGNVSATSVQNTQKNGSVLNNDILKSSLVLSKGELAQNLEKTNDGILVTSMVNKGLQKQTDILETIKDKLQDSIEYSKVDENKQELKQEITNQINDFNDMAQSLKYQDMSLLDSKQNKTIEVNTMNQTLELNVPSTKELGIELSNMITRADLNEESINSIITKIDKTLEQMDKFKAEFTDTQKALVETAKGIIEDQTHQSLRKSQIQDKNFGVETSEFSKANINALAGHLVASQANIPQSHGMKLLY